MQASRLSNAIPERIGSWSGGRWADHPANAHELPVMNPTTGEPIATLTEDDATAVDAAVTAARQRFEAGDWSRASVDSR